MRIRVHFLFLGRLLLASVVLIAVAFGVNRYQVNRQANAMLDQAITAEEGADIPRARKLYDRYLEMRPNSGEAHSRLGLLLSSRGDARGAFFHRKRPS